MTKANKTIIKDKALDLREKIQKQKKELHHQIEQKTKRFEKLLDMEHESNPAIVMTGVLALLTTLDAIRKGHTLSKLKESLQTQNLLHNKDNLVDKLYHHVNERISIIEKAENHDLKEFLKENDVYSVFEQGKLEKFFDSKSKENTSSKQNESKKDNTMDVSHGR